MRAGQWQTDRFILTLNGGSSSIKFALFTFADVETIVLSGGTGERAPETRAEICEDLNHLGINIDQSRDAIGADVISAPIVESPFA